MKALLKKYLLQQPTFFSWLCAVGCFAAFVYLVFGIIAITQSAEGVMVFLFVPYFAGIALVVLAGDVVFRAVLNKRLFWISAIELILFVVIAFNYYNRRLYKVQLVVNHPTDLVVLVEDKERGLDITKRPLEFHSSVKVPSNNIVVLKPSSFELLWYNLRIRSETGIDYTNFYPMQYSDKSTIGCGDKQYSIQFIQLETQGERPASMNDRIFDSVNKVVCSVLGGKH